MNLFIFIDVFQFLYILLKLNNYLRGIVKEVEVNIITETYPNGLYFKIYYHYSIT